MERETERNDRSPTRPAERDIHSAREDRLETTQPEAIHPESEDVGTLRLREERLVARKERGKAGEVVLHRETEEVPGRLDVSAQREEVEVEHVTIGKVVQERVEPWEENGVLVIPIYEEELVVSKQLVLREEVRVRKVVATERKVFEDRLLREHVTVEDPDETQSVRENLRKDRAA